MKLKKEEQERLNNLTDEYKGFSTVLRIVARQAGASEKEMWAYAKKLGGDKNIITIDYGGKNAKLIFEK